MVPAYERMGKSFENHGRNPNSSIIYNGVSRVKRITKKCCRKQINTLFVIVTTLRYNVVRNKRETQTSGSQIHKIQGKGDCENGSR